MTASTNIVRSAANSARQKGVEAEYKEKLTAMMKESGVDPKDFVSVTSFLARGTPEQVLMKIRMYNAAFLTQTREGKHYQTPREVFTSKRGECNDFTSFNQYILNKAHIPYTMHDIFEGSTADWALAVIGIKDQPEGHIFIVARSGDRLYRVDNLGTYYLGNRDELKDEEILNLAAYSIKTLGPKNIWSKILKSDINTPDNIYSQLGLSRNEINNAGMHHWGFSGRINFEPGKPPSIFGMRNDKGSVAEESISPKELTLTGRELTDMREVATRNFLGKALYYIASDNFLTLPNNSPTPYDKPY